MTELNKLTLLEAFQGLREGKFTSRELTQNCLDQIKKFDDKVKAFITLNEVEALAQADAFDVRFKAGDSLSPLAGIPVIIQDIFCTTGLKTTASSKFLADYVPPFDAEIIKRLRGEGAVFLGKTNLDAFALGGSTENSDFFSTRNAWDLERVPGGSSGGSAVAISVDMGIYALGIDAGGGIRKPASFCGVSGLKPSYGRVSRYGAIAVASSLDTIGPLAKNVEDIALIMKYLAGRDVKDSTTSNVAVDDYSEEIKKDIKDLKIGLPKEYFVEGMDAGVRDCILEATKKFEAMGAQIIDISLPHTDLAVAIYQIICSSEISSNMARYDGMRYGLSRRDGDLSSIYLNSRAEGFGDEVKRRIILGTHVLSAGYYDLYYKKATQIRTLICQDFDQAFKDVDVILTPVNSAPAYKFGEKNNDPLVMHLEDVFTVPASLAGLCGLVIPVGFSENLPIGIQILGKHFDEKTILRVGHQYQLVTDWHQAKSNLS